MAMDRQDSPYRRGTWYDQLPIPMVEADCIAIDAGVVQLVVESRRLTNQILKDTYDGAFDFGVAFDDHGATLHVLGTADGLEHLRFDCFEDEPHYHYLDHVAGGNTMVRIDEVAIGDPVEFALAAVDQRLPAMLRLCGLDALAAEVTAQPDAVRAAIGEVRVLMERAQEQGGRAHMTQGTSLGETVEEFRARADAWLADHMPRLDDPTAAQHRGDSSDDAWQRARELQKRLYDGGFAGICYPREYGGLGLTAEYQEAFNEAVVGYELPMLLQTPTMNICGPTLLDMASEEIKKEHLSAAMRGEEVFVQFLSEPRGGSDLAGATTRATRDGDYFILSGSKVWSSGAYAADYALCLVRTDWDAPKHRGLTMLLVKVHQPGITIRRIKQVNGGDEFCQEFFDDVPIPVANVIGEINGGWAVASQQTIHERNAVGGGSKHTTAPKVSGGDPVHSNASPTHLIDLARANGQAADPYVRDLIAQARILEAVQQHLIDRVVAGMTTGDLPASSGGIIRMFTGESATRGAEITLEIAGTQAIAAPVGAPHDGVQFLFRQASSILGGTVEISRNVISERVLNMPREYAADRDVPFSQVRQNNG